MTFGGITTNRGVGTTEISRMRELLGERTEEPLGAMGGSSVLAPFDGWRRRPCPYTPEFIRPLLVLKHMSPHALPPEIYV